MELGAHLLLAEQTGNERVLRSARARSSETAFFLSLAKERKNDRRTEWIEGTNRGGGGGGA